MGSKLTLKKVKRRIKEKYDNKYKLISDEYKNNDQHMKFKCNQLKKL